MTDEPGVPASLVKSDDDRFEVGWAAYKGGERFPPLNDMEAQRWWLGGFGAAWAADVQAGETVEQALARVCEVGRSSCGSCGVTVKDGR